ncbi:sirohydrochlorin ferrochelatase, chloroplastic isoform X2 [Herrania umbratica]|uniref:Sirohydrochlorin ferrochelatase, chloroplastic isoform X2 n=1 Tax=Herrania umbratica TaxID=108875 RepID=A0A6J1BI90_9ROSI|nr:sirohydrochlorin ferrochelatase, chloroplastic isoform X2 [Herrania umbratica]
MSIESLSIPQTLTLKSSLVNEPVRKSTWRPLKSSDFQRVPPKSRNFSARSSVSFENGGYKQFPNGVGEKDGVIIVDHGSRRRESNLMLNEFVAMFRDKTGYLLVEPAHMDIPSLTADAAKEHPGVSYMVTAPLGLHELLVDVVNDRIKHCLSHVAGDADECAACAGTSKCKLY